MKILHIGKFYPPNIGGMESFLFDLVENISSYVSCDVLCSNSINTEINDNLGKYCVFRMPLICKVFSAPISPRMISWLIKRRKKYDIIHIHLPNPIANFAYLLSSPSSKLIIHWHSDIARQVFLLPIYYIFQKILLNRANVIIVTSHEYLVHSKYLKPYIHKCKIIPLGINDQKLSVNSETVKAIFERVGGKRIILVVGRLVYYKGFEFLIEAMKEVDAILLIVGDGPLKNNLIKYAVQCGCLHKIIFTGEISLDDLGSYYYACDIFCLPSIYKTEAFGIVQLEAMSFSKPVIATFIQGSGTSFVTIHNYSGLIVKTQSSRELAIAINKLLNSKNIRNILGVNARKRFEKHFTIQKVGSQILNMYYEVLGTANGDES